MSKVRALVGLLLLSLASLSAIVGCAPSFTIQIGQKSILCIPRATVPWFIRNSYSAFRTMYPRNDPQELVDFQYDGKLVKQKINEYIINTAYPTDVSPNTISGVVYLVNDNYKQQNPGRWAGEEVMKIWTRNADCNSALIQNIKGTQDYLTKCNQDDFWQILFDRYPGLGGRSEGAYDSVLAECVPLNIASGVHQGTRLQNCVRRIMFEEFRIDYDFQVENAGVIREMDAFLEARIRSWRSDCPK